MKASHLALVTLVLGLGLGFAAGAVFHSNSPNGSSSGGIPTTLAADRSDGAFSSQSSGSETLSDVEAHRASGSLTSTRTAKAATTSPEAKRLARQSIEFAGSSSASAGDDKADWTHTIRGTVIDQDGQPLPGVKIVSMNRVGLSWRGSVQGKKTAKIGRAWEGIPDIEKKIAESAEQMLENQRNHRTAVSDAMGRFTLRELREGLHNIQAHADGFAFTVQNTHTEQECAFIGERILELELDVRLPDGSQPDNAVVFVSEQRFGRDLAWSPDEPRMRLKEAAFELTVLSGAVQRLDWRNTASDYSSEPIPMNLETAGPGPHVVQLAMNQILRVSLEDASELVPKLPVWMKVASATVEAGTDEAEIDWSEERHSALILTASGSFQVMDLPKGPYWLAAGRGEEGGEPQVVVKVAMELGVTEETIQLEEVDLSQFMVCHCVRAEGSPVAGVSFTVARRGETKFGVDRIDAVVRGRGEYWLPKGAFLTENLTRSLKLPGSSDLSGSGEGGLELVAKSEIDGQVSLPLDLDSHEITVEFQPVCTLDLEFSGDVSAGFTVHLNRLDPDGNPTERYVSSMTTGTKKIPDGGLVSIMGLQPGEYEVDVYETGHGSDSLSFHSRNDRVMSESITIKRTETTLAMSVPTFHEVTVHAPNVAAGETFRLKPKGADRYGSSNSEKLDENATVTFGRVPAGEYTLSGPDRKNPMEVTVPTGQIQWITEVFDAARVRSVEANGAADQAGFQKGDIIVAIDGTPIKGKVSAGTLAKSAREKSVRLTVLRAGATMDFTLGPLGMVDDKKRPTGFSLSTHTLAPGDR